METRKPKPNYVFIMGVSALALLAFLAGGMTTSSAAAVEMYNKVSDAVTGLDNKGNSCKPNPNKPVDQAFGSITSINGATFTLKVIKGEAATIKTTGSTKVFSKITGKELRIRDLKVGDLVHVAGKKGGSGTLTASTITILPASAIEDGAKEKEGKNVKADPNQVSVVDGQIVKVDDGVLTVREGDKTLILKTSDRTVVVSNENGKKLTRADLKVGDVVLVKGLVNQDGTINALAVGKGRFATCKPEGKMVHPEEV